ncbi:sensor histidine kinase [Phytohabitans rumicis]|uniref:Oxygen sensor histidine kinase NreB n=1 Tax=Phytohabitans rumicis TaxID=1076125 RepID=A0A6V8LEG7_9ACTN|nr:sensor histidine kinase [Phytohabitans rumicis]GFJ92437.1 hypothetical protein Prum_060790 [Phytohabitans rumicis]
MGDIPGTPGPRRWVVAAGLAALAAVAAAALAGQLVDDRAVPIGNMVLTAAIAVLFTPMAALILAGVPGHPVGRLMLAAGAIACGSVVAGSWAGPVALAWAYQWSGWPPLGLTVLALLLFPDGRLPSRRWRPLAWLIAGATGVATVALAVAAIDHPRTLVTTVDTPLTGRAAALEAVAKVAILVAGAGLIGVLVSLVLRWRRAAGEVRQQLACLLPAAVLIPLALAVDGALGLAGAWALAAAAMPAAMTLAVLRYRLYDLDRIVNRTVVWLVMSLLVIVGFVAIVALLRDLVMGGSTSDASLVATGLIAVAFEPVRRRVQHGVDYLLYGDRDNPYKVMASIGDVHGKTTDPDAVLPVLMRTIATSLRLPYAAVELADHGSPRVSAEYGRRTTQVEEFDMVAHGERLGRLLVGPRSSGGHFSRRERQLLDDVAQYAAVVTEATRLIRDLQESRERLIMAREEERRRLRRDLHDGVGPALTGLSMQVRAARKSVTEPARVGEILDVLAADLQLCMTEVRQLLDGLPRPAELDDGLEAALRAQCRRFEGPALALDLYVVESLDGLPAAVEVAAYRIVGEALTNVTKHARARTCRITVGRRRSLNIEVVDDGVGIEAAAPSQRGVGLDSMRERAEELGGECFVTAGEPRGTAVRVHLPIPSIPLRGHTPKLEHR